MRQPGLDIGKRRIRLRIKDPQMAGTIKKKIRRNNKYMRNNRKQITHRDQRREERDLSGERLRMSEIPRMERMEMGGKNEDIDENNRGKVCHIEK